MCQQISHNYELETQIFEILLFSRKQSFEDCKKAEKCMNTSLRKMKGKNKERLFLPLYFATNQWVLHILFFAGIS